MRLPSMSAALELRHGASFARWEFDTRAVRIRPAGECGRATWGRYLGCRWLGFSILVQWWAH